MLQIKFSEIPEDGLRFKVDDVSWFPDQELTRRGKPRVIISLERSGDRVLVNGSIDVDLVFSCDRCLEEFISPQEVVLLLELQMAEPGAQIAEQQDVEYEYEPEPIEVLQCDGPFVDLGDLLYQQMILALPQKILCRDDCRGICEHCGANLNLHQCGCAGDLAGSPFAGLQQLLKNK